jgi:transposase
LPLSEKARVEVYLPDLPKQMYQNLLEALGASGKLMLRALAAGETDAEQMSHLAQGILKRKQPQLQQALAGRFTPAQRWILAELLDQYAQVEAALQRAEARIGQEVENNAAPFVPEAVQLLDTIPGVGETGAQLIVVEIGVDMEQFPTDHHLASWAGGVRAIMRARANARVADHQGQSLLAGGARTSGMGGQPSERDVSRRPV